MIKLIWAILILSFLATVSRAQNTARAELSAGFSHFHIIKGFTIPMEGGSASVAVNVNDWLGFAGDFGAYYGTPVPNGLTGETFTFGPRFSYRRHKRFVPFAQALFGGAHFNANTGGVSGGGVEFAFTAGAGLDIGLGQSQRFAIRPQADYFGFRSFGSTTNAVRLSVGLVYRIGKK